MSAGRWIAPLAGVGLIAWAARSEEKMRQGWGQNRGRRAGPPGYEVDDFGSPIQWKAGWDDDFRAGFAAGEKAKKIVAASTAYRRGKISQRHGIEWKAGYDAATGVKRGAYATKTVRRAEALGLLKKGRSARGRRSRDPQVAWGKLSKVGRSRILKRYLAQLEETEYIEPHALLVWLGDDERDAVVDIGGEVTLDSGKIVYTRIPAHVRQKYLKEYGLANRGRKHNKRVSKCISGKVRGEGWDERQAVAACLNMDREERLRSDGTYRSVKGRRAAGDVDYSRTPAQIEGRPKDHLDVLLEELLAETKPPRRRGESPQQYALQHLQAAQKKAHASLSDTGGYYDPDGSEVRHRYAYFTDKQLRAVAGILDRRIEKIRSSARGRRARSRR